MNEREPDELREDEGLAEPTPPENAAVLLRADDPLEVHRARLDHDADDGEHEGQFVRDELTGGAQRAEQRVLVGARPTRHEHADDGETRHRERVEDADIERGDDEPWAGREHDEDQEGRHHDDCGGEREDPTVGLRRHDVFFLEELHAVTDELIPAVEPARVHRAEPALHVTHHLEQEHVAENERGERHDGEHDHRLEREGRAPSHVEREQAHRSMSPRMKYRPARIVTMSGTNTPRSSQGRIDTLLNDADRIFTRNGPVAPRDTM